jgi:predicted nucleic acid-binding protein
MVLADTSVWVQHLRRGEPGLAERLSEGLVLMHPFISGELACGNLKGRAAILSDLHALPPAKLASSAEVLLLIEDRRLWGRGLGWIDAHLLASALLSKCGYGHLTRDWQKRPWNSGWASYPIMCIGNNSACQAGTARSRGSAPQFPVSGFPAHCLQPAQPKS